jgi:hypothetical protein
MSSRDNLNQSISETSSSADSSLIINRYRTEKRLNKNEKSTIYLVCDTKNDSL